MVSGVYLVLCVTAKGQHLGLNHVCKFHSIVARWMFEHWVNIFTRTNEKHWANIIIYSFEFSKSKSAINKVFRSEKPIWTEARFDGDHCFLPLPFCSLAHSRLATDNNYGLKS